MTLSLVLPCYNEEQSLPTLAGRAISCAKSRSLSAKNFRLVLVENGSNDNSLEVIKKLQQSDIGEFIDVVALSPNEGYGNGIFQGLQSAQTEYLAWTHADEQCDPEDVFMAWEKLKQSADQKLLFKGFRSGRAFMDKIISFGFEIVTFLILGQRLTEINAQPKVFHSNLMTQLKKPPKDFAFDAYVLLQAKKAGFSLKDISVRFPPRKHGESNWSATFSSKVRTISRMIGFLWKYRKGGFS